jgi:hypothetical protein
MTDNDVHPGDIYAHGQLETWFQIHLDMAARRAADATLTSLAALAGTGSKHRAEVELKHANAELEKYEDGYAAYRAGQQPHHSLIETFSRVAGSVGGLDAGFVVVDQDQAGEGPAELSDYAAATRAYRVRQATCMEAMRRWGWWVPGEPPTAAMREELAAEMEQDDAWNVAHGREPVWTGDIAELRGQ